MKTKKTETETCFLCGDSVAWGSGKFVNRIPSGDSPEERKEMNVPNPKGGFLCAECDESPACCRKNE